MSTIFSAFSHLLFSHAFRYNSKHLCFIINFPIFYLLFRLCSICIDLMNFIIYQYVFNTFTLWCWFNIFNVLVVCLFVAILYRAFKFRVQGTELHLYTYLSQLFPQIQVTFNYICTFLLHLKITHDGGRKLNFLIKHELYWK